MRAVVSILLVLILSSCGARKPRLVSTDRVIKDSVIVTKRYETYYDTVSIAADSVKLTTPIEKLNETPITLTSPSGRSRVSLSRKGNQITGTSHCNELEELVAMQREIIDSQRFRIDELKEVKEVTVDKVPFLYQVGMIISLVSNFLLLIAVVFLLFKSNIKRPFL
jgi:hypothetical protein